MHYFVAICGFLGAWLLFAGPLLQAVLELQEQEIDREHFEEVVSAVPRPPRVSRWWWLLPPVAYYRSRRQNVAYQNAVMQALPPEQRAQSVAFFNKATGWIIVAGGAFLLATKETWELVEVAEWPSWLFWILAPLAFALCVANLIVRMNTTNRTLGIEPRQRVARKRRRAGPAQ